MSQRASNACENCRRRKVKCSGDQPCDGCVKHHRHCTYGDQGRKRFSETYVRSLLAKLRSYENQDDAALQAPQDERVPPSDDNAALTSPADVVSGPAFEQHVRSLVESRDRRESEIHLINDIHSGYYRTEPQSWQSTADLTNTRPAFSIPSESESRRLLDLFLLYLGANQHFLDSRPFSDNMTLLYRNNKTRQERQNSLWFIHYLLVMAMGKLMDKELDTEIFPPGSDMFAEAFKRLPSIDKLGDYGVVSVEILAVLALYLQWCDRKQNAYLYIGIAMRLALALGCSQPPETQSCLPSEATHRLRLWWTVFMLDRRLSASLGLPGGADDRQIRSELPKAAAGFPSHTPIVINVQIARVTGDIMSSLYGNSTTTERGLVEKIQSILQSLHDTGKTIPTEYTIDFTAQPLQVTRTGASLYLMLFQAIILCIRPVVLQCVRQKASNTRKEIPLQIPPATKKLCDTCDEVARKSLRMLRGLQEEEIIARFGFFDLDATFGAAFVLVMLGYLSQRREKPPREINMACEVLCYLSEAGNKAAVQRLDDITQFCSNVWPNHRFPNFQSSQPNVTASDTQIQTAASPGGPSEPSTTDDINWSAAGYLDLSTPTFNLLPEAGDIYSSFNDPNFPLTGVDYADWLETERFFAERFP